MRQTTVGVMTFALGLMVGGLFVKPTTAVGLASAPPPPAQVFEIRTYTAADGKLDALKARFRNDTIRIFNRHHMTSIGYWTPEDAPLNNTLIYILAHPSREEAKKNWEAFRADPEWVKVKAASEVQGALTTKVESVFADATDFSPIK